MDYSSDWFAIQDRMTTERRASARYVVMIGQSPYYSTLAFYEFPWVRPEHRRAWNVVGDGFSIDLGLCGIATLEEAIRECDIAAQKCTPDRMPYVVELPIRINPTPSALFQTGFMDPNLTRVYTPAPITPET